MDVSTVPDGVEILQSPIHKERADQFLELVAHKNRVLGEHPTDDVPKDILQTLFLSFYALTGNESGSSRWCGITRYKVRGWKEDPDFLEKYGEAKQEATDWLEAEARRRAMDGTLKPVFHQGVEVGYVREYSDSLMGILLRGNRPEKYGQQVKVTGRVGVQHNHRLADQLTPEMRAEAKALGERIARGQGIEDAEIIENGQDHGHQRAEDGHAES